jgi:hypothetical protein
VLTGIAAAVVIIGTHNFFLGSNFKDDRDELAFYIVMTVLVGALLVGALANYTPSDDDDMSSVVTQELSTT